MAQQHPAGADDVPLLATRDLVKRFGTFTAVDCVTLNLHGGHIHALLGENGAGKSTLVKMIYGSLQPSDGAIEWQGQQMSIASPAAAQALGIGMVFQHFSLFDSMTVSENIALALPSGRETTRLADEIGEVSRGYGLPVEPGALIADLSAGERQRVEIVRCLVQSPKLLIMDEPTAVLTPQEADNLFVTLRRLADDGCAVLYISHRLQEVQSLCHRATILRHGKVVARVDPGAETSASLASLMVGGDVERIRPDRTATPGTPVLEVRDLNLASNTPFGVALRQVSLSVRSGEILAIAGIAGNGQTELFAALSGEHPVAAADTIQIDRQPLGSAGIVTRRAANAAFIPEERLGHGAVPEFPLSDNVLLSRYSTDRNLAPGGFINTTAAYAKSQQLCADYDVRKSGDDPEAKSLSGGNLQKFVVGREVDRSPKLLVVNQPTWGVDAGAAAAIRHRLQELARSGSAVLVISQDLDEIFEIANRIAVISRGQLFDAGDAAQCDAAQIGLLMAGQAEHAA